VRSSESLRWIRIVAGVLVVLGFGVAVILTLNSNKSTPPPINGNGQNPPTSGATLAVGSAGHVKVAPGMYAVAVPFQPLPGISITACSYVDIIQLDANHNQAASFTHVLVLRETNNGAKAAMIVQATPDNLEALVVAANQPYGVQVSLDGQDTSGDCTP